MLNEGLVISISWEPKKTFPINGLFDPITPVRTVDTAEEFCEFVSTDTRSLNFFRSLLEFFLYVKQKYNPPVITNIKTTEIMVFLIIKKFFMFIYDCTNFFLAQCVDICF